MCRCVSVSDRYSKGGWESKYLSIVKVQIQQNRNRNRININILYLLTLLDFSSVSKWSSFLFLCVDGVPM